MNYIIVNLICLFINLLSAIFIYIFIFIWFNNLSVSQSSVISSSNYQLNDQIISEDSIYSSSSATLNAFNLTSSQYKPTESTIHEKSYLTYSDKSVVRQICRKIYSLLRLTDFRLRESLYECVENNLINFRSNLHRIRSENDNMNPDTPLTEVTIIIHYYYYYYYY